MQAPPHPAEALEARAAGAAPAERARLLSLAARAFKPDDPQRARRLVQEAMAACPGSAAAWIAQAQLADPVRDASGAARDAALHALGGDPDGRQLVEIGLILARAGEQARGLAAAKAGYEALGSPLEHATSVLRIALQAADWQTSSALTAQLAQAHREGRTREAAETPRTHLLWCADEATNLAVFGAFARRNFPARSTLAGAARPARGRRMRIGYLSSDYRDHATSLLFQGLMRHHDRSRYELFAYCIGWDDGSPLRRQLLGRFDHVRLLGALSDQAAAKEIAADRLDILVDLNGLTEGMRMGILAWRPAPTQVAYLGFPGSVGGRFVDFVVGDAQVMPPGCDALYPEKLVRLERTYQVNDYAARQLPRKPSRAALGLPPRGLVAGMFNNVNKVGPEAWGAWMAILKAAPQALLWVLDPGTTARENLRRATAAAGVELQRLVFAPKMPQQAHLARMQHCDLMLDPWPYGGHTSTADALFAGVPVVALEGTNFASRVSGSLLRAAGLRQLVHPDRDAYVRAAVELLERPEALARSKQYVREITPQNDVFDARTKARQLEGAYEDIHGRAAAGERRRGVMVNLRPASEPELVLVCGPWSSGTSAVAGLLAKLGLEGGAPYFKTRDERTPNSFESLAFRELVQALAAEESVELTADASLAAERLREFKQGMEARKPIFLKYPLSALLIPQICGAFRARLVYVLRPLEEIEATRLRRGWPAHLGAAGARRIYASMFEALVEQRFPTHVVRYAELLDDPLATAADIARFAGVKADPAALEAAAGFIRRP